MSADVMLTAQARLEEAFKQLNNKHRLLEDAQKQKEEFKDKYSCARETISKLQRDVSNLSEQLSEVKLSAQAAGDTYQSQAEKQAAEVKRLQAVVQQLEKSRPPAAAHSRTPSAQHGPQASQNGQVRSEP
jgi:chromosome segregation ATPase